MSKIIIAAVMGGAFVLVGTAVLAAFPSRDVEYLENGDVLDARNWNTVVSISNEAKNILKGVFVREEGKIGIGKNPTEKLDVNGNVKGTGLCIGNDCRTSWEQARGFTFDCSITSATDKRYVGCGAGYTPISCGKTNGDRGGVEIEFLPEINQNVCIRNNRGSKGVWVQCCRIVPVGN